jgi:hypothetical protein
MKTYEIKIKSAPGSFHKIGHDAYHSLNAALKDVKLFSEAFKPESIFVFCNGRMVCKTENKNGSFRDPYYEMSDGFQSFSCAAVNSGDDRLVALAANVAKAINEITDHLNSNYLWD